MCSFYCASKAKDRGWFSVLEMTGFLNVEEWGKGTRCSLALGDYSVSPVKTENRPLSSCLPVF